MRTHKCLFTQWCSAIFFTEAYLFGRNDLYWSAIKLGHWKENHAFNTFQNRKQVNSSFCCLVFFSCLFCPWMDCLTLGKPRCAHSESRQMKSYDLLLPAASQTVYIKSNFSLNKTGALVFSALCLLRNVIIARMSVNWLVSIVPLSMFRALFPNYFTSRLVFATLNWKTVIWFLNSSHLFFIICNSDITKCLKGTSKIYLK